MGLKIADILAHLSAHDMPSRDGYRLIHIMDAGLVFPSGEDRESCRSRPFFVWTPTTDSAWEDLVLAHPVAWEASRPGACDDLRASGRSVTTHYAPTPPVDDAQPDDGRPRGISLRF